MCAILWIFKDKSFLQLSTYGIHEKKKHYLGGNAAITDPFRP